MEMTSIHKFYQPKIMSKLILKETIPNNKVLFFAFTTVINHQCIFTKDLIKKVQNQITSLLPLSKENKGYYCLNYFFLVALPVYNFLY